MKKRFSDEQIVLILRQKESGQKTVEQISREHGISVNTFYTWQRKVGAGLPCAAEHPNHLWSYDFVEDRTEGGRKLSAGARPDACHAGPRHA